MVRSDEKSHLVNMNDGFLATVSDAWSVTFASKKEVVGSSMLARVNGAIGQSFVCINRI